MPEREPGGSEQLGPSGPRGAWARYLNMTLACWLFLSAFIWHHSPAGQLNNWVCGGLIFFFSLWALVNPSMRIATALTAVWLFFTSLSIPWVDRFTPINSAVTAVVIFFLAWVPGERLDLGPPERHARA